MSDEMGALAEDLKVSTLPHFQFFKVRACVRAHVCVRMCLCECVCVSISCACLFRCSNS